MHMSQRRRNSDVWDQILHEVALDAAQSEQRDSERDRLWADDLAASTRVHLAKMRHEFLLRTAATKTPIAVKAELLALDRPSLLARLASLLEHAGPSAQLAYRDLSHQSDDDLRLLVTVIEEPSRSAH
jgi:hypothetical protein